MKKQVFYILILLFVAGCKSQSNNDESIGIFDISKDDKHILFSFYSKEGSSICQMNTDGTQFKDLISATKDTSYFNPQFSPDGKRIVFIGDVKSGNKGGSIFVANSDGTHIERLITGNGIITEAVFSSCNNEIIYIKANEYGKSSQLGKNQAHDVDIYTVNLSDKKVKQITNLKAYGLFQVSEFDCNNFLLFLSGPEGGMFTLPKKDQSKLNQIAPANNPRGDLSLYYLPRYSQKYGTLAFVSPYQLYTMDMKNKKAKLLYDNVGNSNIGRVCFFNTQPRVLFLKKDGEINFYSINLDGSGYKIIPVPFN